jgi:hypothetical protein
MATVQLYLSGATGPSSNRDIRCELCVTAEITISPPVTGRTLNLLNLVAGRYVTTVEGLGSVITESDGTIMNVISGGSEAGPEFQGWFVEMLIFMLAE